MATRMIGVEDTNPRLPDTVMEASASDIRGLMPDADIRDWGAVPGGDAAATRASFNNAVTEITANGGARLRVGEGPWNLDAPFWHPSFVHIEGVGEATILRNTNPAGGAGSGIILPGTAHPAGITNVTNRYNRDTLTLPAAGDQGVTRTSSTLTINVGDVVYIFNSTAKPRAQFFRIVTAIDGSDLLLHLPLDGWDPTAADAFVAIGTGYNVPISTPTAGTLEFEHPFCRDASISNLAVDCPEFYWIDRGGTVNYRLENIYVMDSAAGIYGNGYQGAKAWNVYGSVRNRAIEATDGTRDSDWGKIDVGVTGTTPWEAADYTVWAGINSEVHDSRIVDYTARTAGFVNMTQYGCRFRGNRLHLKDPATFAFLYGAGAVRPDASNNRIIVSGEIGNDLVRMQDAVQPKWEHNQVEGHTGYAAGKTTVSFRSAGGGLIAARVHGNDDDHGGVGFVSLPEFDPDSYIVTDCSWDRTTALATLADLPDLTTIGTGSAAPYPPATRAPGSIWMETTQKHTAMWDGTAWQPLNPTSADANICCVLGAFGLVLDAQQYTTGSTWQNLGTVGSTIDATLTEATAGTDGAGHRFLAFAGVASSRAGSPDNALFDIALTDDYTMIAVFKAAAAATAKPICGTKNSASSSTAGISLWTGSSDATKLSHRISDGSNQTTVTSTSSWSTATRTWILAQRNHTADQSGLSPVNDADGTLVTGTDNSTGSLANTNEFRIGASPPPSTTYHAMDGYLFGFIKRLLTSTERTTLDTYLAARFT